MKKILVIQTASIGDVILTTPVLEKLHLFYPNAQLDLLLKKGTEQLFVGHPFLHHVYVWNKKEHKYNDWLQILKAVRKERYDWVICIQRFAASGLLTVLSKAKHTTGFSKNPFSAFFSKRLPHRIEGKGMQYEHEAERNLLLIKHLADNSSAMPRLYPTEEQYQKVASLKENPYICVAPASLWFTKQYPKEKWIEFIKSIDVKLKIYYLGGKPDEELCSNIIDESRNRNSVNLAGKLDLLESAALMQDAQMNFVNDSSPMHLASSVNAPVTAIFCSTIPEFGFGPLSDDREIVQVHENLKCRPCGLHGYKNCPQKHFRCALHINNNDLLNRITDY